METRSIDKCDVPACGKLEFATPLSTGENLLTFHSSMPPLEPGNGDGRKMSVLIEDAHIEISGL
jgi:hypothetical protein